MKIQQRPLVMLVSLGALVLVAAGAHWMFAARDVSQPDPPATSASPSEDKVVLSGFVDLEGGIVSLYAFQPGRVDKILVQENHQVSAGTGLVALDERLARWKLDQADADLKAAEIKITQAKQLVWVHQSKIDLQKDALEAAEKRRSAAGHKFKRAQQLFDTKLMPREEIQAAEDLVKEAEAGVRAERTKLETLKRIDPTLDLRLAEMNLEAKKAQRAEAKLGLDERVIRAPADGIVLRINVGQGDVIGPIPQEPTVLFAANQHRIIRFNVEQEFAAQVKAGYPAEVRDYLNPDLGTWKGKVVRVADVFMQTRTLLPQKISLSMDETRTLEGSVMLDPGQSPLRLGQRMRVIIKPGAR